ncbi:MAG TPA: hypothetical protein VGJ95_24065 [Pseudonocardiaceae bacterium]|jgi:hypothetical protein
MVQAATAVICLAIAGVLWWKRRAPKTVALLALVAGAGITTGALGGMLRQLLGAVSGLVGQLTTQAVGVAVPTVLAVVLLLAYLDDMWPKHKATTVTALFGFLLPIAVASVPGIVGSTTRVAIATLGNGVSALVASLFGGTA